MGIREIPMDVTILVAAGLLVFSILASRLSQRLGVPALLLFLGIGMLAGSDGPGGIYFDDPWLAQFLGTQALATILFAAGMDTRWEVVRKVFWPGISLATIGVLGTAGLVGLAAHWWLGVDLVTGLLMGAVVSSTDAAAVFSILKAGALRLKGNLEPLLELESGSNDPMAFFLTIGLTAAVGQADFGWASLVPRFLLQIVIGGVIGFGSGYLLVRLINRLQFQEHGLYLALTAASALLIFGLASWLGGNGFLAVYLGGIMLGSRPIKQEGNASSFMDGLAWLMQIAMFLTLGLLVYPSRLLPVAGPAFLIALFLTLVARPAAVFLALAPFRIGWREKSLVAWAGLRGAVPIILATFPLLAGVDRADLLFDTVFFVTLLSVAIQGTLLRPIARRLGLEETAAS